MPHIQAYHKGVQRAKQQRAPQAKQRHLQRGARNCAG
jgi:hypothetical protein